MKIVLGIAIAVFVVSCLVLVSYPNTSSTYESDYGTTSVTIHKLYGQVHIGALVTTGLFFLFLVVGVMTKHLKPKALYWMFLLFLYPVSCTKSVLDDLSPWTEHDRLKGEDGQIYVFLGSHFLQGNTDVVGRLRSSSSTEETYDVLVESHETDMYVVRPGGSQVKDYGQLLLTKDGLLVALSSGNRMCMAYDFKSKAKYTHSDLWKLSPFLLLEEGKKPFRFDVKEILDADPQYRGLPARAVLERELENPNPVIQQLAKQFLDANKFAETEP